MAAMYRLKTIGKALCPPIIWRSAKAILGLTQDLTIRSAERGPDWYDRSFIWTERTHKHYTESMHYFLWTIIAHLMVSAQVRAVLDVGCGSGQLALLLRDKGIKDYRGFDFSRRRIHWARRTCPEFTFVVADALETDLFDTFDYDAVICTEFLEHVERDIQVIDRIRKGALFFATVPNFPFPSHVRHFKDSSEVYDRYSRLFENFSVDWFPADKKGKVFFLLQGTKK
ncbi:MAG: class I SAM-dependent methyltransferase [Candidatus Abyssobacteria bacterium SURF_17]|jgi:SAM-dependent methyltransferase|uniref:Class I SAM-dependent methyltransferase n=1 Tax=Candidatus Abyssobacteria bacterium SURF_17 TaxID=2093361 RepID=A0A419EW04_9BACT|nr:MAG: class I SAM-dependent methyltransferase [Candidatus Abyssubacteria bacterium SURF_17]